MTPQSSFMVVAPLSDGRRKPPLRSSAVLDECRRPGRSRIPGIRVVPFGEFDRLHFARFVILDDATTDDIAVYGVHRRFARSRWPSWAISTATA